MSIPEPVDVPDSSATVLYVGNLDRRVTDVMMTNILRTGLPHLKERVLSAKMFAPSDPTQGPDGYCFVQFQDNNAACQAMTFLNGRDFCGKKVKVNWATNSSNGIPKIIGSSVTIFVGDLDDDITDGELRQAFDPFGDILNAKVCRDAVTNKSKNYGFISFTNKPDAEKAIREMHGSMLKRRPIKTNWATRNQKTQPVQYDYDQVYKETSEENCTVYVTNLPDRISDQALTKHFELYGKILGSPRIFEGKNFAFIKFDSHAAAATAIVKANGSELNGCILKCWWGKESSDSNHNHVSNNSHSSINNNNSNQQQTQATSTTQYPYNMTSQQYMQYMQYYQYWMQYQMVQQGQMQPVQGQAYQYPYAYQQPGAYPQPQQQQQQQPGQPNGPPQMQQPQMQQQQMQQQQMQQQQMQQQQMQQQQMQHQQMQQPPMQQPPMQQQAQPQQMAPPPGGYQQEPY